MACSSHFDYHLFMPSIECEDSTWCSIVNGTESIRCPKARAQKDCPSICNSYLPKTHHCSSYLSKYASKMGSNWAIECALYFLFMVRVIILIFLLYHLSKTFQNLIHVAKECIQKFRNAARKTIFVILDKDTAKMQLTAKITFSVVEIIVANCIFRQMRQNAVE